MAIEQLERASVGRPITRGGVSLYPIYLHGGAGIDIAARPSDVEITEQGSAEVPMITVTNPGKRPRCWWKAKPSPAANRTEC